MEAVWLLLGYALGFLLFIALLYMLTKRLNSVILTAADNYGPVTISPPPVVSGTAARVVIPSKSVTQYLREEWESICVCVDEEKDPQAYTEIALSFAEIENYKTALSMLKKELMAQREQIEQSVKEHEPKGKNEQEYMILPRTKPKRAMLKTNFNCVSVKARRDRQEYIASQKPGRATVIPALTFTLSRDDVFDFISDCSNKSAYPVTANIMPKNKRSAPDILRCGEWCFGLMYEKSGVIKFVLRLDEMHAYAYTEKYTAFENAIFPVGDDWFDIIINSSFGSKAECYALLKRSYQYILGRYYLNENGKYITNSEAASTNLTRIKSDITESVSRIDLVFDSAITEREDAITKLREEKPLKFKMTRAKINGYVRRRLEAEVSVYEPSKWFLPVSFKTNGKLFCLLYENRRGLSLTLLLPDKYARRRQTRHPEFTRARFPRGRNWYTVAIDGSFSCAQSVYRLIRRAKSFAENKK